MTVSGNAFGNAFKNDLAFSLHCGMSAIASRYIAALQSQGFVYNPKASIAIVLDMPNGFAPHFIATAQPLPHQIIIATWSFSPEYCDDLWDTRPTILLVGQGLELDVARAIEDIARGLSYRISPLPRSPLTSLERRILQLLANNYSVPQIAEQTKLGVQTVKNRLTMIYQALGVNDGKQAILYYWSIWHVLDNVGIVQDCNALSTSRSSPVVQVLQQKPKGQLEHWR
jgi:DNA-binding CsgD family transcriptional regulator